MKSILASMIIFTALYSTPVVAANVEARVDISEQKMKVYKNGRLKYVWKVSTGRRGYSTPTGNYKPYRMHEMWYSRKYNMSPMPHSIFYRGGYAVHGTSDIKKLGRVASHGCIRLHPSNAKKLFRMVKSVGPANASIKIKH